VGSWKIQTGNGVCINHEPHNWFAGDWASSLTLSIADVEATLNDQSGQVQIIVDTQVFTNGAATAFLQNINFQVTILAVV
jgi:hypothetical protein